jgi:hypothetical protein
MDHGDVFVTHNNLFGSSIYTGVLAVPDDILNERGYSVVANMVCFACKAHNVKVTGAYHPRMSLFVPILRRDNAPPKDIRCIVVFLGSL